MQTWFASLAVSRSVAYGLQYAAPNNQVLRAAWFVTRNYMEELLPRADTLPTKLLRAAAIGFTASAVSDTCSNSVRVLKTTRQTAAENLTYPQALKQARRPAMLAFV